MQKLIPIDRAHICTNMACSVRVHPTQTQMHRMWVMFCLRICSLLILSGMIVASVGHIIGQGLVERQTIELQRHESSIEAHGEEIKLLRAKVSDLSDEVALMHGVGIGLASILAVLQIAQIIVGKGQGPKE